MGFTVTGPEVTISTRTVKAFFTEQIIFNVQIADILDTQINNYDETSGLETVIDLEAAAGDLTALFPAGAVVYLFVESGAGYTDRGVVASSAFGAPHAGVTTITFTELFGIGTTAVIDVDDYFYIISQKKGRFFKLRTEDLLTDISGFLYVHPDETGLIEIDTGPIIDDYLRANSLDSVFFSFHFKEEPTSGTVHGTDYIAIQGGQGPAGKNGSAAFLQVTNPTGAGGGGNLGALPMSRFWTRGGQGDETVYEDMALWWQGWTTTVSYLFDEDTGAVTVYIQENNIFKDGVPTAVATLETITTAITDPQVFEKTIQNPHADAIFIETFYSDTVTRANASKKVVFAIIRTDFQPQNPLMLKWRNSRGGFSHWLFGGCNDGENFDFVSTGKGTYEQFQGSNFYSSPHGTALEVATKKTVQKMTVEANYLTYGQLTAIREIVTTSELYAYNEVKTGTSLVRLTVDPGSVFVSYNGNDTKTVEYGSQSNAIKDIYGNYSVQVTVTFPPGYDYHRDQAL